MSELQILPLLLRLHALSRQVVRALLPPQAQAVPDHRHGRPNVIGLLRDRQDELPLLLLIGCLGKQVAEEDGSKVTQGQLRGALGQVVSHSNLSPCLTGR